MANTYFQFKEFRIHQEKAAMKVCTDACLFGAWVRHLLAEKLEPASNGLDIGTGTGLLSLMLIQSLDLRMDAVELDKASAIQAADNFAASNWNSRLSLHHTDILQFQPKQPYSLIICNPPFFEQDLKPGDAGKNLAKHETRLKLQHLFELSAGWLSPGGWFALLLPAHREQKALEAGGRTGLHLRYRTRVRQTEKHAAFRTMLLFSKQEIPAVSDEITIREGGIYTGRFTELLRPYYLKP